METQESRGSIRRMGEYCVEQICPSVYAIDDDQDESMYLVCGSERALMIDTGSNAAPVMPLIRSLYTGPVELALTHAHFDHMYHCDEFSAVSLHQEDVAAWKRLLRPVVWISTVGSGRKAKHYPVERWQPLKEGDLLLFGDMAIYTTCKNNTFNGMPLPAIYVRRPGGGLECLKRFGYADFKNRLGSPRP